ncbi:MAG: type II secretion system GspH family protein [Verrucomicrobiota bacterium]|nr:type II secretion system GspH family protein [Verrucomicrobiota bacterium]
MKTSQTHPSSGFTLIELLVVISIIAILAGIALPVFGEVQTRGAQTKALSNAKQIGTACKLFAMDYNGIFPMWSNVDEKTEAGPDSNSVLKTLIPDYVPDKAVFSIPKSAFCRKTRASSNLPNTLDPGDNEWAYVIGLTDTSNPRFPLLADGFVPGSETSSPYYVADDTLPGGVWKGKRAVVIRCDVSGTVETTYKSGEAGTASAIYTVKRSDEDPKKNAFQRDEQAIPPWLQGSTIKVLNPLVP